MQHIKGPDFPTGGIIVGREGIKDAYETGRGRVVMRGRAHVEPLRQGKEAIIVTELPYQVQGRRAQRRLGPDQEDRRARAATRRSPRSPTCATSPTGRGMRLVIELKRDAIPKVVLNKLYKHTSLQTTFGVNMVALVDGVPRTLDLREVIRYYVDHQSEVITRRTKDELRQREARAHILEGLLIALDEHRRGDRADPRARATPSRPRRPDREVRALAEPGAGDPRHAPAAPDRARDATRSSRSTTT